MESHITTSPLWLNAAQDPTKRITIRGTAHLGAFLPRLLDRKAQVETQTRSQEHLLDENIIH